MKAAIVTLLIMLSATSLMASKKTSKTDSDWDTNSTWNPGSVPGDNDSIVIRAGDTVSISGNHNLNNVVIIVLGRLDLSNNGKLNLDAASKIYVQTGGIIVGNGNSDQIKLGSDMKWNGSDPPVVGPQYADNNTGGGFAPWTVLAANFQSFFVTRQGANIQLSWSTSAEVNNAFYAIERSADSRTWNQIAQVTGAGTSDVANNYGYTDKSSTNGDVYYRIRLVSTNGTNLYSAIRSVHNGNNTVTNIFASTNKTITIDFNSDVKDNVSIQLINMSGQVIVRKEFSQASYRLIVDAMSAGSGVYAVRISDSKGWSEVKKIAL